MMNGIGVKRWSSNFVVGADVWVVGSMNRIGFTRGGTRIYGIYWIVIGCISHHCLMRNERGDGKAALRSGMRIRAQVSYMRIVMSREYRVLLSYMMIL